MEGGEVELPRSSRKGEKQLLTMSALTAVILLLLVFVFPGVVVTTQPSSPESPLRQLQENPVIQALGEPYRAISEALSSSLQQASIIPSSQVGLGAVIGYTSATGESVQYQTSQPFSMSGVAFVYAGIHMKPDKPEYKALKLYDEDTGAEGEIWYKPFVSIVTVNGTVENYDIKVETRTMLKCDDGTVEILQYNSESRGGVGKPPARIDFEKASTKGSHIYNKLRPALNRGATSCYLQLVADYEGVVKFAEDEEPVRKTLTNVVLGTFELRKITPKGDFEFMVSSNATVRPLAEVMVGGEAGMGELRTVTYTETRYAISTVGTQTVTKTEVKTKTQTVNIVTTVTKTVTVTRAGEEYFIPSGILIEIPYDAFIFFPQVR
ncbi:MAG: hypothetical protein QXP38_00045 [Nitrososphaerota archaeon]